MADLLNSTVRNTKRSFRKTINRHSTKVDLTPMVDLGFLLITFFVFTTSMANPTVMKFVQPADGKESLVRESGAMTILLSKDHGVYYYFGKLSPGLISTQIRQSNFKDIRSVILDKKNATVIDDLMFIIKGDSTSTFGDCIDILDEMLICNIPPGHFIEANISQAELQLVKSF